ncbi:putative serine dehydratase domain-containing protein [Massariosphaeria phaeospora]|uniref:D-serine dehydratase n=1 Tax=Massariosphaeria phaeospora TaxID=100035 RepID=A0A7C8IAA1_9PLEO|nr:putative serine dehydratase domain-containing protein [Massariosphaeria phaeospora]
MSYPLPTRSFLLPQYLHKSLSDVGTPAIVLDRAIVRRNCAAMLDVCRSLGVGFRAHVKSHKTLELSKLQVGDSGPAHFIVSTVVEAEHLLPFAQECQAAGRACSILYGVPVPQSTIPRLLALASNLAPFTLHILTDHISHFEHFHAATKNAAIGVYIKIDTGYQRAGIKTSSPKFEALVKTVVEKSGHGFQGFYSHFGHSYGGDSEEDAANGLIEELNGLELATRAMPEGFRGKLVLTVGATPTATAAQNMLSSSSPRVGEFKEILARLGEKHVVELHAGVYPLLDLQQVATRARPQTGDAQNGFAPLSQSSIGCKVLVEVTSIYDEREKPEALISAGSLALGREPCKSYPGWGIVTGDLGNKNSELVYDERGDKTGWIVGRVSQEHGILTWEGPRAQMQPLTIGDKLLVWPNHACVAGAGFGWYLIVDSEGGGDKIVDVWVRWRGW